MRNFISTLFQAKKTMQTWQEQVEFKYNEMDLIILDILQKDNPSVEGMEFADCFQAVETTVGRSGSRHSYLHLSCRLIYSHSWKMECQKMWGWISVGISHNFPSIYTFIPMFWGVIIFHGTLGSVLWLVAKKLFFFSQIRGSERHSIYQADDKTKRRKLFL